MTFFFIIFILRGFTYEILGIFKKNKDFRHVYDEGKSYANRILVMYAMTNGLEKNRLGISVSKKVGNSVIRHRLTRLIRESYRLNESHFPVVWISL